MRPGPAAALVVGFLLRAYFVVNHAPFAGDTLVYGDLAHNLLAHHTYGLTEDSIRPTLIRLPGYPLFLAACFLLFGTEQYLPVLWVQVLVDLAGCVVLGRLAGLLWGRRAGVVALWIAALCPFTANYAAAALAETLSLFCVSVALWALARWWQAVRDGRGAAGWAVGVGVALSGATLLRPDGLLLAVAVMPVMLWVGWRGAGYRGAVVATGMLCAVLAIWAGRNWRVFHVVQPLAPKYANDPDEPAPLGFARWYRTWAIGYGDTVRVYWTYDGSPLQLSDLPARAFEDARQKEKTAALYAQYNDAQAATPAIDAAFAALAAERVRAHPVRYTAGLPLAKLADMWFRPRTELLRLPVDWWAVRAHPRLSIFEIAYAGLNAALLGLAVVGWVRWRRLGWSGYRPVAVAAAALVLLRSGLLLTIDNSEPRYTLECFPVVLLLASLVVARLGGTPLGHSGRGTDARG